MKHALASLALLAATFASAAADDTTAWLLAYAKRSVDRYPSEVPETGRRLTVLFKEEAPEWLGLSNFDPERAELSIRYGGRIWRSTLSERCAAAGTFVGTNGYGAKRQVRLQRCERLEISDNAATGGLSLQHSTFAITPADFRALKALGVWYEIEIELGYDRKVEAAWRADVVDPATVQLPIEKRSTIYLVNARFHALKMLSHDQKQLLLEVKRD